MQAGSLALKNNKSLIIFSSESLSLVKASNIKCFRLLAANASLFNLEARNFNKDGFYCSAPFRSKDFINYWEDQKNKCRLGVIYINKDKTWNFVHRSVPLISSSDIFKHHFHRTNINAHPSLPIL